MQFILLILLVLALHFSATAFVPTASGKAWLLWPFDDLSRPVLPGVGGLPKQGSSFITPLLAGAAVLGFGLAILSWLHVWVPEAWFAPLTLAASGASLLLFGLYFSPLAVLPILIAAALVIISLLHFRAG